MTVQNTQSVTEVQVVDVELITKQFHHLQADIDFTKGNKSCFNVSIACVCNKVSSLLALIMGSSTMVLSCTKCHRKTSV
jgi:hydroxymethylpyrimidine/phosphomethylpyrimidine kinase